MKPQYALVSDFDGTISNRDFFWLAIDDILGRGALSYWEAYTEGRTSHFQALQNMFAQIHIPEQKLNKLIDTIGIDECFEKTAAFCAQNEIPFYICSAGCDYYINRRVGEIIKKYGIKLIANHAVYSPENGLQMTPLSKNNPYFDAEVGVSKKAVVSSLRGQGVKVVFAGDGGPDVAAAQEADFVFARDYLLQKLNSLGRKAEPLFGFCQINAYLRENIS